MLDRGSPHSRAMTAADSGRPAVAKSSSTSQVRSAAGIAGMGLLSDISDTSGHKKLRAAW